MAKRKYQQEYDIALPVRFDGDQVALDIPDVGAITENGWAIQPVYKAQVSLSSTENYILKLFSFWI